MTAADQARTLTAMMICGALLGAAYDGLGMMCRGWAAHAADLFFGVLAAAGMTAAALMLRTEAFRLYTFAGAAAGFAAYRLTLGMMIRRASAFVRKNVKKRENSS